MSIQSFAEKLLADMDGLATDQANALLKEARQLSPRTGYTAGKMDGFSEAAKQIKATYALFVRTEKEEEDDSKPLY